MKIAICGSLDFISQIQKASDELVRLGHSVLLPKSVEMVINGETTIEIIQQENQSGKAAERKIQIDAIKQHYKKIAESGAILVLNLTKKNIQDYIGIIF